MRLLEGLPLKDGAAMLRDLDSNEDYGLKRASQSLLEQLVSLVHGVPRALQIIASILANDPFLTIEDLINSDIFQRQEIVEGLIQENFQRLDSNLRIILQGFSIFEKPITTTALEYLLIPFIDTRTLPFALRYLERTHLVTIDRKSKYISLHPIDRNLVYHSLAQHGEFSRSSRPRAADYFMKLRLPKETWKTIDDLQPQLLEIDFRMKSEDYDTASEIINNIDEMYLSIWGHTQLALRIRQALLDRISDPELEILNLIGAGKNYRDLGDFSPALHFFTRALELATERMAPRFENLCLGYMSYTFHIFGMYQSAVEHGEGAYICRENLMTD